MDLKPLIKARLRGTGFDKLDAVIDGVEVAIQADLEQKAEQLITRRLIKRVLAGVVDQMDQTAAKTGTPTLN